MADKKPRPKPAAKPPAAAAPFDLSSAFVTRAARPAMRGEAPPMLELHKMILDTLDSPDASLGAVKLDVPTSGRADEIIDGVRSTLRRHGHKVSLRTHVAKDHILFWAVTPKTRKRAAPVEPVRGLVEHPPLDTSVAQR